MFFQVSGPSTRSPELGLLYSPTCPVCPCQGYHPHLPSVLHKSPVPKLFFLPRIPPPSPPHKTSLLFPCDATTGSVFEHQMFSQLYIATNNSEIYSFGQIPEYFMRVDDCTRNHKDKEECLRLSMDMSKRLSGKIVSTYSFNRSASKS
jgi:hypothetical protein